VKVLLMKKLMKSCNQNLTVRQLQTTRLKRKCRSRSRKNWKSRSSRRLRLLRKKENSKKNRPRSWKPNKRNSKNN